MQNKFILISTCMVYASTGFAGIQPDAGNSIKSVSPSHVLKMGRKAQSGFSEPGAQESRQKTEVPDLVQSDIHAIQQSRSETKTEMPEPGHGNSLALLASRTGTVNSTAVEDDSGLAEMTGRGPPDSDTGRVRDKSQDKELGKLKSALAKQVELFNKQQKALIQQAKALENLKSEVERLSGRTGGTTTAKPESAVVPAVADNSAQAASSMPAAKPKPGLPEKPVGKAPTANQKPKLPELPRFSDTLGGVLTPQGKFMLEPSFEYAYSGNNRVFLDAYTFLPAIAVGLIDIRQVQRHTLEASGSIRYGITDTWEVAGRVPFIYRQDLQRSRPVSLGATGDETFTASGYGVGDVEFTTRYQINSGSGGWPIFVANLSTSIPTGKNPFEVKFADVQGVPGAVFPTELPTGVGYYSIQPSMTFLYPSDPAAFFANFNYSANLQHHEYLGTVDPGDAVGAYGAMSFSINEKSSFSLGYSQKYVFNSYINGTRQSGSQLTIGEFLLGLAYKFTKDTSLTINLSVGATPDAQDMKLVFRLPMYFQGF